MPFPTVASLCYVPIINACVSVLFVQTLKPGLSTQFFSVVPGTKLHYRGDTVKVTQLGQKAKSRGAHGYTASRNPLPGGGTQTALLPQQQKRSNV